MFQLTLFTESVNVCIKKKVNSKYLFIQMYFSHNNITLKREEKKIGKLRWNYIWCDAMHFHFTALLMFKRNCHHM